MKDVVILVDVSWSMSSSPYGNPPTPIETAVELAKSLITRHQGDQLRIAVFAKEVEFLATAEAQSLEELVASLLPMPSQCTAGSTRLFDSAASVASALNQRCRQSRHDPVVHLLTDGDDCGSREIGNWDALSALMQQLNVKLEVHNLGRPGDLGRKDGPVGSHIQVTQVPGPPTIPVPAAVVSAVAHPHEQYEGLSCPLICLDPTVPREALNAISSRFPFVVRYLEELTGLRYYPAPTVIVDESTRQKLVEKTPPEPEPPEDFYHEAMEMLNQICLMYHCHYNAGIILMATETRPADPQGELPPFAGWVRSRAEYFSTPVHEFLTTGQWPQHSRLRSCQTVGEVTRDNLKALKMILAGWRATAVENPDRVIESYGSFAGGGRVFAPNCRQFSAQMITGLASYLGIESDLLIDTWAPTKFRRGGQYGFLDSYEFQTTASQYVVMLEGLSQWVTRLLMTRSLRSPGQQNVNGREARRQFVQTVRRYGFYRRLGLPVAAELPEPIPTLNAHAGMVVLCAKPICETILSISRSPERYAGDLAADMFGTILLHEHFHAIIEEGREPTRGPRPAEIGDIDRARILEESLAEWTQLDYDRANETMRDWVVAHALSGSFPSWPYAGALWVENTTSKRKNQRNAVRKLISDYRRDASAASNAFLEHCRRL